MTGACESLLILTLPGRNIRHFIAASAMPLVMVGGSSSLSIMVLEKD
jgi:hypothetical protein